MEKNKNIIYLFFIFIYLIVGVYLSITNGITSDESFEQLNWEENILGIKSLLEYGNYDDFLKYQDKYHGIAFHYLSQPFQFLSYKFISSYNNVSYYGAYLISKHSVVLSLFFVG